MKALHQIINYLQSNGLLDRQDLVALAGDGFYPWEDLFDDAPNAPSYEIASNDDETFLEPAPRPRGKSGRGGKGGKKATASIDADQMCRELADHADGWRPRLDAIRRIGSRLAGSCPTWESACVAVRNATDERLPHVLGFALEHGDVNLASLWDAMDLEDYRGLFAGIDHTGPAAFAYRTMLRMGDHGEMGSNAWLLARKEVSDVFNLRHAQRRLQRACGAVTRARPELLAVLVRRGVPAHTYWSLVLLHTARRGASGKRPLQLAEERMPPRAVPGEAEWPKIWGRAVAMDREAVTPFLIEWDRLRQARKPALRATLDAVQRQLPPTTQQIATDYYDRSLAVTDIAIRHRTSEAAVLAALHRFRIELRRAMAEVPALQVYLYEEQVRTWESFLIECMRWGPESGDDYYPSITLDLLCPRNWD